MKKKTLTYTELSLSNYDCPNKTQLLTNRNKYSLTETASVIKKSHFLLINHQ